MGWQNKGPTPDYVIGTYADEVFVFLDQLWATRRASISDIVWISGSEEPRLSVYKLTTEKPIAIISGLEAVSFWNWFTFNSDLPKEVQTWFDAQPKEETS